MAQKPLRTRIQLIPADEQHRDPAASDPESGASGTQQADSLAELAPLSGIATTNRAVTAFVGTLNNNAYAQALRNAWI